MQGVGWPLVVGVLVLVSGCAGSEAGAGDAAGGSRAPLQASDVARNEYVGAVQGTVLTQELEPIAGAVVGLRGTQVTDQSDENGLFQMPEVAPGRYTLDVARIGFQSTAKAIEVVVGELLEVRVLLEAIELTNETYHETIPHAGYLECALGGYAFVAPCSYPYRLVYLTAKSNGVNLSNYGAPADLHPNKFWLNFSLKPKVHTLVVEMDWLPGSAAATVMNVFVLCGDFDPVLNECTEKIRYGNANGHSGTHPIRATIDGKEFRTKGCPGSKFCSKDKPVWITNDVAMPFYNPEVAFQQKFNVWDTMFFNGAPPEGFTVIPE